VQLTRFTDYAMRMLIYLALREDERNTLSDIAQYFDIPRNHLAKIAARLVDMGLIETQPGNRGGLWLAVEPCEIGLGDLVRETEPHFALVECLADGGECRLDGSCALKSILVDASSRFLAALDEHTLEDIVRPARRRLRKLQLVR
jgi:Rrf2 family nitric oxide-sensitive transcriptional repressor